MSADIVAGFRDVMRAHGLETAEQIHPDGKLHRVRLVGDSAGSANGFYILHTDGSRPAGAAGCWKRGFKFTWKADGSRLSATDRKAFSEKIAADRKLREREERERYRIAAKRAQAFVASAVDAPPDHEYLVRKGIGTCGAKLDDAERLVIPLRDATGTIWSYQTIAPGGGKLFLLGGRTKGLFHLIGEPADRLLIVEGFATGASLYEATNIPVIVAFNAGNLIAAGKEIRERWPVVKVVIAADDDHVTAGNPGLAKARAAAEMIGAEVAVPVFAEDRERGTDFNDLALAAGAECVAAIVTAAFEVLQRPPPVVAAVGHNTLIAPIAEPAAAKPNDPRERIDLAPQWINDTARKCAQLLREDIFMRGRLPSALVRAEEVCRGDAEDGEEEPGVIVGGVRHAKGSPILTEPSPGLIQFRLDDKVAFFRFDKRSEEWVKSCCPKDIAGRLIDAATELRFRPCAGIVTVPLFLSGEIVATAGYHAATGAIVAFDGSLPAIPEQPSRADALAALDVLLRPFRAYFSSNDIRLRSAFAAGALTSVARPSLPAGPAIVLDANVPGAGKGKAARALAMIATGRLPAIITEGHGAEETEKRIAAAILSGSPAILLDNLQGMLASSTLESGLTEGIATIRVFGKLVDMTVPCSALVLATANNATFRADMLRRILPIRIVVDTDQPEKRRFAFEPYTEAKRDRLAIIAAALTILRAWWMVRDTDDGRRIRQTTLGSFEQWADLVAGAVEWLTGFNPVTLVEERKAEDHRRGDEQRMVEALFTWRGTEEWTAKEAVSAISGADPDCWAAVLRPREGGPSAHDAGVWLRRRRDRVFGDKKLVSQVDRNGVAKWRIAELRGMRGFAGDVPLGASKLSDAENPRDGRNGEKDSPCHSEGTGANNPSNPQHPQQTPSLEFDL
jgi:putative DNA primase/helicase